MLLPGGRRLWITQGVLLALFTSLTLRGLQVNEAKVSFVRKLANRTPEKEVWCLPPLLGDEKASAEMIAGFNGSDSQPLPFEGGMDELMFSLGANEVLRCRSPSLTLSSGWDMLRNVVSFMAGSEFSYPPAREPTFAPRPECENATALWMVSRSHQTDGVVAFLAEEGKDWKPISQKFADMFTRSDGLHSVCYPLSSEAVFLLQKPRGAMMLYICLLVLPLLWRLALRFSRSDANSDGGIKDYSRDFVLLVVNSGVCIYRYFVLYHLCSSFKGSFDFSDHIILDVMLLFILSLDFAEMTRIFSVESKTAWLWKVGAGLGFLAYFAAWVLFLAFVLYTTFFTAAFFHTPPEVRVGYGVGVVMIFCAYWALAWLVNRTKSTKSHLT